ncbi:MAG TPA: hypothetical protein VFS40_01500 [Gemmatimonadales bacterium]|nr:hypothetical protein [Gemmatimonadales bacterium]
MTVLLVHGLGRTPFSMRLLGRRLRRAGHEPRYFGYAPWAERHARIVGRLAARVRALDATGAPWAAVGHSLGGLLLRLAIADVAPRHLAHLVMLGTPNQPPRLARRAVRVAPFRWLTGESGRQLASAEFYARLPAPTHAYTLLAGTRGVSGRLSPFGDEPNDGIVALSEVRVRPGDAVRTFPITHTFMMNHRAVQDAVLALLAGGGPTP